MRLTLAVAAVAAILLAFAAVAAAAAVRTSLATSALRSVNSGGSVAMTGPPWHCTSDPGITSCTGTLRHWDTGQRDTLPVLRGGGLSLWPWTDPTDARPVMLQPADGSGSFPVAELDQEQAELNTTVWWLTGGTLALTLLAAGGTWLVIGRALQTVEVIRTQFDELSLNRLDLRIPTLRGGREFTRLVATMNNALDRLKAAADRQRQFTSDVAHELRTPLACLRAELELALTRPEPADWPDAARHALQDALHLQDITTDLLFLARLDTQAAHTDPLRLAQQVDLADLIRDVVARRDPPGHLSIAVTAPDDPAQVPGHPGLLTRVLTNLLDNAERHAATTVTVTLTLDNERRQAVLDVANDGPPIPAENRETIFERFTRLDDARTRNSGGTGLGLAIARRILTLHHGILTLAADPEGARFTVRLPLTHEGTQPLVTELLHTLDHSDYITTFLISTAGRQPLEDVLPDLVRALTTAGRGHHLHALLLHVAQRAPAWEVTGLADVLREEGMPAAADELLAARAPQRGPALTKGRKHNSHLGPSQEKTW